jgi:hypothetical protein
MLRDPSTAPGSLDRHSPQSARDSDDASPPAASAGAKAQPTGGAEPTASNASVAALLARTGAVAELQASLVTQDRIIAALEADNQRLLLESKELRTKLRDSQTLVTHLQAQQREHDKERQSAQLQHQQQREALAGSSGAAKAGKGGASAPRATSTERAPEGDGAGAAAPAAPAAAPVTADEALTAAQLRAELQRLRDDVEAERRDMARKVAWYVDRQAVGAAHDALIAEQQSQLAELRLRAADLEAQVAASGAPRASDKDRVIRTLTRRVTELEEQLRTARPDSLAELIRAARPPLTESAEFNRMKAQLAEATTRLETQEEVAQRALAQLRVESDGVRAQYARRLERVEEEMKLRLAATQTRKTRELEKALAETRRFYGEKVHALEQQLAGFRRGDHHRTQPAATAHGASGAGSHVSPTPHFALPVASSSSSGGAAADAAPAVTARASRSRSPTRSAAASHGGQPAPPPQQQQLLQHQSAQFGAMGIVVMTPSGPMMLPNGGAGGMAGFAGSMAPAPMLVQVPDAATQQRATMLEARVRSLEEENRFLQRDVAAGSLSTGAAAALQAQLAEAQREVATLQRLLRDSHETHRRTAHELEERLAAERTAAARESERVAAGHRDELKALQTRCDAEIRLRADSVASRQLMAFSSGLANVMGADLGANCGTGELRRYLLLLAERVHCLERQLAAAESEHARQLAEVRRVAEFDLEVERQRMGVALKQKNVEIDSFRVQLDRMLAQIADLRG